MSEHVGFLVVTAETGYLLEGRDHAAKIFETPADAKEQCPPLSKRAPVKLGYEEMLRSLFKGSTFCFANEGAHTKFLKRLRNDPGHKAFVELSRDRDFISWRVKNETPTQSVRNDPSVAVHQAPDPVPPAQPPVEAGEPVTAFNPAILVREGN